MYQLLLTLILCWLALPVLAQQQLARARQSSYLTKVFRLTEAQTRRLYEHGLRAARADFFTVPVDSFPTDKPVARALPLGYYLVAHTEGPELVYWLRAETGRRLEVVDNQTDLMLVLRDSLGRLLPDARVAVRGRPMPYDAATHIYRRAHGGRAGLVAVAQGGRTTFHPLEQSFPNRPQRTLGQMGRRVLFGPPLGYLSRPVRRLVLELRHPTQAGSGVVGLLVSPFSGEVRRSRHSQRESRQGNRWTGYLVTSQPRYRPGDTLRLKARVLRRNTGRPCTQPLVLWLNGEYGKRLATLHPVRAGTYEYALPLTDTLGLKLDEYAQLSLYTERGVALTRGGGGFRYEDYELKNDHYSLRGLVADPRRGQPQAALLRGYDANELNLLDARVRLALVPFGEVGPLPKRRLFLPDTLWTHAQALDPLGETRLDVPARVFPDVDFHYLMQATFLTSDNERHIEEARFSYRRDPGQLRLAFSHDSVRLSYDSLGYSRPHRARLSIARDDDDHYWTENQPVQLPLALPLNPLAQDYELDDAAGRSASLTLDENNADLTLTSERTPDSLRLVVDNPHRIPFWYYVYRGDHLQQQGYGPAYALAQQERSAATWHVSLHYRWGTEMRTAEYAVGPAQRQLVVATDQPAAGYPGQHLHLKFSVTDEAGQPVPDADLTAYAYTSKFAASDAPRLPQFGQRVLGRRSKRRFRLGEDVANDQRQTGQHLLEWARWHQQLGLDSLQFYHFLYPTSGTFSEYRPAPGGLTQVAPFVVDSGRVQAPIAFYIDDQPAYIHDISQLEPYTAVADSGYHTLSIRTASRLVTLRRVQLRSLHKLTLSIDVNHPRPDLTVVKMPAQLTPTELLGLRRTVLAVEGNDPATVRQGRTLRLLNGRTSYYNGSYQREPLTLSGPFRPDSVLLRPLAGGSARFLFEPLYAYYFGPRLLKMKQLDPGQLGLLNGSGLPKQLPLGDFAYTEADLRPRLATYPLTVGLRSPQYTPAGQGRLEVRRPRNRAGSRDTLPEPLYTLLTRPDQPTFARLGYRLEVLHDLPPGRYRVAVLLADSSCLAPQELVLVEANGQTLFQLATTDRQPAGPLSHSINQRLWQLAHPRVADGSMPTRSILLEQPTLLGLSWGALRGRVIDRTTGEGLPGVTVLVQGTQVGTSTNADGGFTLQVPPSRAVILEFSFVGYRTEVLRVASDRAISVSLAPSMEQLGEVVVTGAFGSDLGYSPTNFVSGLAGKVSGLQVQGLGANPDIRITLRGTRSISGNAQPLIVINGIISTNQALAALSADDIENTTILKGTAAVALYGAIAANGALIITTKGGFINATKKGLALLGQLPGPGDVPAPGEPGASLRRHFADYAWWRPTLTTDAQGRAAADVVLPDDVTSWDTFVLGSDGHGRVGSLTSKLRAFKSLRAELAVPRFLLAGDQVQVLGKVLSYRPDTVQVTSAFRVGGQVLRQQTRRVASSVIDTLLMTAPASTSGPDSVQVTFGLTQASGYADGEQRLVPVLPVGTRERVGTFATVLAADTTVQLSLVPGLGEATVRVESDALPVLLAEIQHLQQYAYLCNEQVASRLLGLLLEQRIRTAQGEPFRGQKTVNSLIRKLQEGRHQPEGLWGTWPKAEVSPWATLHVVEALLAAKQAGYAVNFDQDKVQAFLLHELDESFDRPAARQGYFRTDDDQVRLLHLLHTLGAPADYVTYVRRLEQAAPARPALDHYLALIGLRQELRLPYQLDSLRRYRRPTELGGVFYADTLHTGSYFRYLLPDKVGTTLLAYQLLRTQGGHATELARIRAYLLGLRGGGYWPSTYQTAWILSAIGPDLLATGGGTAQVQFGGAVAGLPAGVISKFPFEAKFVATGTLTLHKTGGLPVYATAYQTRWNPAPTAVAKPFTVTTALAGQPGRRVTLPAGRPAELLVTVDVKAEAHYVLLEVPIPAGCSYGDPAPTSPLEVHREYLKQQAGIFIDNLPIGRHTFRVALQPRYRGTYTLNPARAELLYFPTRFGRTDSKQVLVR
ncbi:MAG: carboxypeptidase-like regulatory domain-containing protein [Janthinobacterium lividum]